MHRFSRQVCGIQSIATLSSQCQPLTPVYAVLSACEYAQDPAFDKIIKALYGDVDQFDAEVSNQSGGRCLCLAVQGLLGPSCAASQSHLQ